MCRKMHFKLILLLVIKFNNNIDDEIEREQKAIPWYFEQDNRDLVIYSKQCEQLKWLHINRTVTVQFLDFMKQQILSILQKFA